MTRSSTGIVERMRWMTALPLCAFLAIAVTVALRAVPVSVSSSASSATSGPPAPGTLAALNPAGSSAPLDPRIASIAAHHPGRTVEAIVQFKGGVGQLQAQADVARVHGNVFGVLQIINGLAVKLTAAQASKLSTSPDVHSVSLNTVIKTSTVKFNGVKFTGKHSKKHAKKHGKKMRENGFMGDARNLQNHGAFGNGLRLPTGNLQTLYNQTIGDLPFWQFGFNGAGVGVGVIDTGIDGDLPDFQGRNGSRVVASAVINPDATTATDSYGHGTLVAGIIGGNGDARDPSDPDYGQYIGVAPNANLVSIKVADEQGNSTVLDVIYGLQFAVDHQQQYNIRVVNMSLDSTTPQSYTTDPLDAAVESAWMHGIVVVVAAGNRGSASDAVQYSPANDPYAITVGASNEQGSTDPANDTIASWSSRGTTQDGIQKPDVYAPGTGITSVLAPNSYFSGACPGCITGNGQYFTASGTSLATPVMTGLVADLLQIHPRLTPDQVKGVLTDPNVATNSLPEDNAIKVALDWNPPPADQGLTPNNLITDSGGNINYNLSSWSLSSWSTATGSLAASFARSSWSCNCTSDSSGSADPSLSSWSLSSWSTYFGQ
jgi:serine protease AprX